MKKFYEEVKFELVRLGGEEVVRTSGVQKSGDDFGEDPFDDNWSASQTEL
ncbi:MAG: hypothetical protein IJY62_03310 [Clostridia bacterium]|nr:hypothetical protein [Clostridia bacterium]